MHAVAHPATLRRKRRPQGRGGKEKGETEGGGRERRVSRAATQGRLMELFLRGNFMLMPIATESNDQFYSNPSFSQCQLTLTESER